MQMRNDPYDLKEPHLEYPFQDDRGHSCYDFILSHPCCSIKFLKENASFDLVSTLNFNIAIFSIGVTCIQIQGIKTFCSVGKYRS